MKFSRYNYQYKFKKENKTYNVLYNTLYGSVLLLNGGVNVSNLDSIDSENKKILEKNNFLITNDLNEIDLIRSQNKIQRFNDLTFELTILPTRWCNLNCQYCFEDRKNIHMTDDDINSIYRLIQNRIDKINCVSLLWFGGEPLLEIDKLEKLSKRVKELAKIKKVQFKNSIITNGTLLTKKNCERLKDCDIRYMQITLDGPPEMHNKRKPTVNGGDTFDLVLKNLINATEYFDLSLRINIDKENRASVKELVDILADKKLQDKMYVYIAKVENVPGACSNVSGTCLKDIDFLNSEQSILEYLKKKGFTKSAVPSYRLNYCTADNIHSFSILPNGDVHKCWHLVGVDDEVIGKLTNDGKIMYNNKLHKWLAYDPFDSEKCKNCNLLPLCMGGCPKNKIIDNDAKCDFLKNIIEKYLEKLIISNAI